MVRGDNCVGQGLGAGLDHTLHTGVRLSLASVSTIPIAGLQCRWRSQMLNPFVDHLTMLSVNSLAYIADDSHVVE